MLYLNKPINKSIMYANYFTFKEFVLTDTGLDNSISSPSHLANIANLWDYLNQIRAELRAPIFINSAFRTAQVNKQVGGSKRSLHMQGRAADIRTKPEYFSRLRSILAKHNDELSELIEYGTFFHIAL